MLHVVDCARLYGRVDGFSSYKYENSIRKLQFLVKSKTHVFSQIRNRLEKRKLVGLDANDGQRKINLIDKKGRNRYFRIEGVDDTGPPLHRYAYVEAVNGNTCSVRFYKQFEPFFEMPLSIPFGIVAVQESDLGEKEDILLSNLITTCYRLPTKDNKFVLPPCPL